MSCWLVQHRFIVRFWSPLCQLANRPQNDHSMKKANHILYFEKLTNFDNFIHGFSTRFFGSMLPIDSNFHQSLETFTKALGIPSKHLVRMHQVHGDTVTWVSQNEWGQVLSQTDGMMTRQRDVFFSVIVADCIPLFVYDPETTIVGVVHAGWRGLFQEIIPKAIAAMIEKGSKPENIIVGIGPCIRSCCYDIASDHRDTLLAKFPDWEQFITERKGKYFLDLPGVAQKQLLSAGVLARNIEDAEYCTFDHNDVYSYRREGKEVGRIIGIIGMKR